MAKTKVAATETAGNPRINYKVETLTPLMIERIAELLQPEIDEGIRARRAMTCEEIAEYLALGTSGERVEFFEQRVGALTDEEMDARLIAKGEPPRLLSTERILGAARAASKKKVRRARTAA